MARPSLKSVARFAFAAGMVWGLYFLKVEGLFRLYPVAMVSLALGAFAISLFRTPLIEVFARKMGEDLDERGVAYCRRVTIVWTVFLSVHLAVTIATVFASRQIWAIYNGGIAYLLMSALFLGEWLYRRRFRHG